MSQVPSIGRIVTYREAGPTGGFVDRAALITATVATPDSDCVDAQADLYVYGREQNHHRLEVPFSDQETPSTDTWFWPVRV